jgi:hypothetical protein
MGRYFRFNTNTFNFATRCDVTWRKEYFTEFTFGGARDQRIYGLTRVTPSLTCAYDMDGLKFLQYVLGTISANGATISVSDLPEISTIHAGIDYANENAGILNAKIDTWEFTVEEGNIAKAEFNAIGKDTTTIAPTAYTTDFNSSPLMPYNFSVTINTSSIDFNRLNLRINNGLQAIFKTSTLPVTLRPTGLEIEGRIRVPNYITDAMVDGSLRIVCGTIGTIDLATCKVTEIPVKAQGYDLPETEYSFTAFPLGTTQAIKVHLQNTILW